MNCNKACENLRTRSFEAQNCIDFKVTRVKVESYIVGKAAMKVLTASDKVANVGNENEPTVVLESQKLTKEELNR